MKFTVSQPELLKGIKMASRAVGTHNTLPILHNILVQAEENRVILTATNLEMSIKAVIPAEVSDSGALTVPSKTLLGYVGLLKADAMIKVKAGAQNTLEMATKNAKTKIKGLPAEDFPAVPSVSAPQKIILTAANMKKIAKEVAFAAEERSSRPVLSGIYLSASEKTLTAVSTDSYRLSEAFLPLEEAVEENISCLVPVRAFLEAEKMASGASVTVLVGQTQVQFTFDGAELTNRLIDGQFPNYKAIIPKEKNTTVALSRAEMENVVRRVSLFSRENNQYMKFDFDLSGKLKIFSDVTDIGNDESDIMAEVTGQGNIIALNAAYVLECLSAMNANDEIVIELQEKMNPVVFKVKDREDFLHLIMPLKV